MSFQINKRQILVSSKPSPEPESGLNIFRTKDKKIIEQLMRLEQQNLIEGLRIYNTEGENVSFVLENAWLQLGTTILGEQSNGHTGQTVSISSDGNTMAIGTPRANEVRVYEWNITSNPDNWTQLGSTITGMQAGSDFGTSVSINRGKSIGNSFRIVIGAEFTDNGGFIDAGSFAVYEFTTDWMRVGSEFLGVANNDRLGHSVSINDNGTIIAVSANNGNSGTGVVQVYSVDGGNPNGWTQVGLDITGDNPGDDFGQSISLSADGLLVAVGIPGVSKARVYEFEGGVWQIRASELSGTPGDFFGGAISITPDGNRLVVGAGQADATAGVARVYEFVDTDWVQVGNDINGVLSTTGGFGGFTGFSVNISDDGNRIAIGNPFEQNSSLFYSGTVRVYDWNTENITNDWILVANQIDGPNTDTGNQLFGFSVNLSSNGNRLVIGCTGGFNEASKTGLVQVFSPNDVYLS